MKNHKPSSHFGLPLHVIAELCDVFSKYAGITRVILYGSRAIGRERVGSDIDLCIESEGLSLVQLLHIKEAIDDLSLPWTVDLSLKSQIDNPNLLKHIEEVGVVFWVPSGS